jgi:serine/threonine-protein kinase PRP4
MIVRMVSNIKPTKELREILLVDSSSMTSEEQRLVSYFVDFLDKGLNLNPEKRLSVKDALLHPFIYGNISKTAV